MRKIICVFFIVVLLCSMAGCSDEAYVDPRERCSTLLTNLMGSSGIVVGEKSL